VAHGSTAAAAEKVVDNMLPNSLLGWWVGVQGSKQHRRTKNCQLQGRHHLAATTRGPMCPGTPRAADNKDVRLKKCNLSIGLRATVGPFGVMMVQVKKRMDDMVAKAL